jgi:hypothetical protein
VVVAKEIIKEKALENPEPYPQPQLATSAPAQVDPSPNA